MEINTAKLIKDMYNILSLEQIRAVCAIMEETAPGGRVYTFDNFPPGLRATVLGLVQAAKNRYHLSLLIACISEVSPEFAAAWEAQPDDQPAKHPWRDKSDDFWLKRLQEELRDLEAAMTTIRNREQLISNLKSVAAVALNWATEIKAKE